MIMSINEEFIKVLLPLGENSFDNFVFYDRSENYAYWMNHNYVGGIYLSVWGSDEKSNIFSHIECQVVNLRHWGFTSYVIRIMAWNEKLENLVRF